VRHYMRRRRVVEFLIVCPTAAKVRLTAAPRHMPDYIIRGRLTCADELGMEDDLTSLRGCGACPLSLSSCQESMECDANLLASTIC
jgi:hypothetical protein